MRGCKATLSEDAEGGFVFGRGGGSCCSYVGEGQYFDFFGFCCGVSICSRVGRGGKTELIATGRASVEHRVGEVCNVVMLT